MIFINLIVFVNQFVDVGAELVPGINFTEEFFNSSISLLKGSLGKFAGTYGGPLMIFELISHSIFLAID